MQIAVFRLLDVAFFQHKPYVMHMARKEEYSGHSEEAYQDEGNPCWCG